jgi:hypothetical protein
MNCLMLFWIWSIRKHWAVFGAGVRVLLMIDGTKSASLCPGKRHLGTLEWVGSN